MTCEKPRAWRVRGRLVRPLALLVLPPVQRVRTQPLRTDPVHPALSPASLRYLAPPVHPVDLKLEIPSPDGMFKTGWWTARQNGSSLDRMRLRLRPKTRIAVVGSSGNLLHHGRGAEIDAHDVVIRVNGATLSGYEHDVGVHADIRVGWLRGLHDARVHHAFGPNEMWVLTCVFQDWSCTWPNDVATRALPEIACLDMRWVAKVRQTTMKYHGSWPSTGMTALAMALSLAKYVQAEPVSVYGFGACHNCNRYFDCDGTNSSDTGDWWAERDGLNSYHAFGAEADVRASWAHAGQIRLFEPSCDGLVSRAGYPSKTSTTSTTTPKTTTISSSTASSTNITLVQAVRKFRTESKRQPPALHPLFMGLAALGFLSITTLVWTASRFWRRGYQLVKVSEPRLDNRDLGINPSRTKKTATAMAYK